MFDPDKRLERKAEPIEVVHKETDEPITEIAILNSMEKKIDDMITLLGLMNRRLDEDGQITKAITDMYICMDYIDILRISHGLLKD